MMMITIFIGTLISAYCFLFSRLGVDGYATSEIGILIFMGGIIAYMLFVPDKKRSKNIGKPPLSYSVDVIYADGTQLSNAPTSDLNWNLDADIPIISYLPKPIINFN
jgi:hypothetical protein